MTDLPAFEIPIVDDVVHECVEAIDEQKFDVLDKFVEPGLVEDVRAVLSPSHFARVVPASVGRGAEGYGLALEIVGVVSDVGGAIAFGIAAAKTIQSTYLAICRRLKRRPSVSIGAARLLAAANLAQRLSSEDFSLLGSGELDSNSPDTSFTSADYFWVAFASADKIYMYSVDAYGRVHFMGELSNHDCWERPMDPTFGDGD